MARRRLVLSPREAAVARLLHDASRSDATAPAAAAAVDQALSASRRARLAGSLFERDAGRDRDARLWMIVVGLLRTLHALAPDGVAAASASFGEGSPEQWVAAIDDALGAATEAGPQPPAQPRATLAAADGDEALSRIEHDPATHGLSIWSMRSSDVFGTLLLSSGDADAGRAHCTLGYVSPRGAASSVWSVCRDDRRALAALLGGLYAVDQLPLARELRTPARDALRTGIVQLLRDSRASERPHASERLDAVAGALCGLTVAGAHEPLPHRWPLPFAVVADALERLTAGVAKPGAEHRTD